LSPVNTHIATRSQRGKFTVKVKTMHKRLRRGLKAVAEWCKENRHRPVSEQQDTLNAMLRGHYQYYGRTSNYRALRQFYEGVKGTWKKWLSRRTRGTSHNWDKYLLLLKRYPLALPRVVHSRVGVGSSK
jgi:RNA-directed DNA polymerase